MRLMQRLRTVWRSDGDVIWKHEGGFDSERKKKKIREKISNKISNKISKKINIFQIPLSTVLASGHPIISPPLTLLTRHV